MIQPAIIFQSDRHSNDFFDSLPSDVRMASELPVPVLYERVRSFSFEALSKDAEQLLQQSEHQYHYFY